MIFVSKVARARELNRLLEECNFPSICIHGGMKQPERIAKFKEFKDFSKRILVTTDLFGRGIDIERVNIVINYDMPDESNQYLHRVGRAGTCCCCRVVIYLLRKLNSHLSNTGRFGTKGLAISFSSEDSEEDQKVLKDVQERFDVSIPSLPDSIDISTYMS